MTTNLRIDWYAYESNYSYNGRIVAKIVDDERYNDTIVYETLSSGSYGYLLYIKYETGNSFGREGNKKECIYVFDNHDDAVKCADFIAKEQKKYELDKKEDYKDRTYKHPNYMYNGNEIIIPWDAWQGYFERLEDIDIIGLRIK